jgi:Protein of unknown function (DUF3306)
LADPAGFLQRWSRLKQAERDEAAHRATAPPPGAAPLQPVPEPEDPLKDLPALDSLTKDSDFRPFMREGVPEELRNQALRKLWASDPVYANLDGLLEYGEDFGEPFRMAGVVATIYRVLEGMPDPEKPAVEPQAAEPPAAAGSASGSELDDGRASFETAASRPPQDEEIS